MSNNIPRAQSMLAGDDPHTALRERLCALVDGELEVTEVEATVAQCDTKDWATYHLIGAVMRQSENIQPVSSTFAARMSAALEREPAHRPKVEAAVVTPFAETKTAGWRRWLAWPAVAMTAAVASVVWIAQPLFEAETPLLSMSEPTYSVPAAALAVASPSVSAVAAANSTVQDSALNDYAEAHRQMAGPIAVQQASYMPGGGQ